MGTTHSRAELEAARELLERAHAYIEAFHFTVCDYGAPGAPGCYIGTMRMAANLRPEPSDPFGDPAEGGPDGLEYALRLIDRLVYAEVDPTGDCYETLSRRRDSSHAGRMAEICGIYLSDKFDEDLGDRRAAGEQSEAIALGIFRSALSTVNQRLEELEASRDLVPA